MLSGVGPAEQLTLREIEVLLDQPAVGENLERPRARRTGCGRRDEPVSLLLALEPGCAARSSATQTGPLASNLAEGGGFVRVEPARRAPDVQFHAMPVQIVDEGTADPEGHGVCYRRAC